jgi:hypothetical protein
VDQVSRLTASRVVLAATRSTPLPATSPTTPAASSSGRHPAGLSDEALVRRPERMLSSALKFGTTAHLAPHPRQIAGDERLGVPPLQRVYGDDLGNIQRLIALNLGTLENAGLDDSSIRFDTGSDQFLDSEGNALSRADLGLLAKETDLGRVRGAGGRTLARRAVLRALLREASGAGEAGGGRNGVLARLAGLGSDAPQAVRALFSRSLPAALEAGINNVRDVKLPSRSVAQQLQGAVV